MLQSGIRIGSQHHHGVIDPYLSTPKEGVHLPLLTGHISTMLAERVGANVARLRDAKGWSRPELGRRLIPPTSGQQIERLEKNQRELTVGWIERLARALNVDPAELLGDEQQAFTLTGQVADEMASTVARVVLAGAEPSHAIVQDVSLILQELSAMFARHPSARRDPEVARPVIDFVARQHARQ